ncbi:MAG TPA: TIGR04086 family membrane protein [Clostridia bacterium]|nr:TIGR04086 family membrane protein [Clostridia bacterium]HOR12626.1 TIGR04086 family membrane protein [Clostridia bacterium]
MAATRRRKSPASKNGLVLRIIKAALFGCVLTILAILLFALLLKWDVLLESSIPVVTSFIKALCAGATGFMVGRGLQQKAWLFAGAGGAAYVLLAFIAFAVLEKVFAVNLGLLADLLMGFIAGIAGGLLTQLKKT